MIILDCIQGDEVWHGERNAIPTSTGIEKIVTSTGKLSSQSDAYMNKLLSQYVEPAANDDSYRSSSMDRGNELEPQARELYQSITGHLVEEVGGIWFDENKDMLCSPDGLIRLIKRGLEIKNPELHTHIGYVRAGVLPTKYIIQVQSGMMFSGYKTWDFMSNHPNFRPLIITVHRDEKLITKIRESVLAFNMQLKQEKAIIDQHRQAEF